VLEIFLARDLFQDSLCSLGKKKQGLSERKSFLVDMKIIHLFPILSLWTFSFLNFEFLRNFLLVHPTLQK